MQKIYFGVTELLTKCVAFTHFHTHTHSHTESHTMTIIHKKNFYKYNNSTKTK